MSLRGAEHHNRRYFKGKAFWALLRLDLSHCARPEIARPAGIPVVVNDRADVAVAAAADGVHLGQDDLPVEAARRVVGDQWRTALAKRLLSRSMAMRSTASVSASPATNAAATAWQSTISS